MPYQIIPASVYHNRLKAAFKFDDDDLAFNREGNLSPRQSQVFEKTRINQRNTAVACLIVAGLMGVLLLISSSSSMMGSSTGTIIIVMLVGALTRGSYFFYRSFTAIRDTKPGAVGSVQGIIELVDEVLVYTLKIGNMAFRIQSEQVAALQNDEPYSIYYLPQRKVILSIEWLFESALALEEIEKREIPEPGRLLEQAFRFDEEILNTNRRGYLTQKQSEWLAMATRLRFQWAVLMVCTAGVLSLPVLTSNVLTGDTPIFLGITTGFLLAAGYLFYRSYFLKLDLDYRQTVRVQGIVHLNIRNVSNDFTRIYTVQVQNLSFHLTPSQFFALKNLEPYTFYCLPHSRRILSVEWMQNRTLQTVTE